jgi:hypothetical protein
MFGHTGVHDMGSPYVTARQTASSKMPFDRNRVAVDSLNLDAMSDFASLYKNPDVADARRKRRELRQLFITA